MNRKERYQLIEKQLTDIFSPQSIVIIDESDQHIGHPGHLGAGHYHVTIVAERFTNHNALSRHRMVYQALADYLGPEIHALTIVAKTPSEIEA